LQRRVHKMLSLLINVVRSGRSNFLCGLPHMILEYALRARHPHCMIFNHNSTMSSDDTYILTRLLEPGLQ